MLSEGSIVAICTCIATITTLYFQNKNNAEMTKKRDEDLAEKSKSRVEDLKVAVDGKITKLIEKVESESVLKVQVASLTATAAGKEEGEAKAALVAMQHDAIAAARALPPTDAKIVNGKPEKQIDHIEQTGNDSNVRIKTVEANTDRSIRDITEKVDAKEDKANPDLK